MKRLSVISTFSASLVLGVLLSPSALHAQNEESASPPENMPFRYGLGYELFQDKCAECHGANLTGTEQGPPLLHGYYKPDHHGDVAFFRAIQQGSPQHHWNFGNMEPVEGVDQRQAGAIVEFVRWYQREKGLF